MKNILSALSLIILCSINISAGGQIIQRSGYIFTEITSKISNMPSDSGNHYQEPTNMQMETWESTLDNMLLGNYSDASDSANVIGYNLVNFTDTFDVLNVTYYILENAGSNYWGSYVYNPNFCRPLVIQSPHAKKDANTGHEGIHVFRKTQAMFYQVNGTHRCNSSVYSTCTGTTAGCSSTSTSEAYRNSDMAHNIQSIFQRTTEVLFYTFDNTYFIQLHGFTKQSTDPYVIVSNGTQETPPLDYMVSFTENLYLEDTVLSFKIAHIDTAWTRLRGFWNTQGRLINFSFSPCNMNAPIPSGRFFHVEQEKSRLRDDVTGWNKVANALNNTFTCIPLSIKGNTLQEKTKAYPNPTSHFISLEWEEDKGINLEKLVYNLLGQNLSKHVEVSNEKVGKAVLDLSQLPTGLYLINFNKSTLKIYKN